MRTSTWMSQVLWIAFAGLAISQTYCVHDANVQRELDCSESFREEAAVSLSFLRDDVTAVWSTHALAYAIQDDLLLETQKQLNPEQEARLWGISTPIEPLDRLCVCRDGTVMPVTWPGDLEGYVTIADEEDAEAFLLLFSSPDNVVKFPHYPYMALMRSTRSVMRPGMISDAAFRQYGLVDQKIVRAGDDFQIMRSVALVESDWTMSLSATFLGFAILSETVTRDGGYTVYELWRERVPDEPPPVRTPAYR